MIYDLFKISYVANHTSCIIHHTSYLIHHHTLTVMKKITTIQSIFSSSLLKLTGKTLNEKKKAICPVENEELFNHLFIDRC
jgi:hypothetical protein